MRYYNCHPPKNWVAFLISSVCLLSAAACDSSHSGDQWVDSSCFFNKSDAEEFEELELEVTTHLLQVQQTLQQAREPQNNTFAVKPGNSQHRKVAYDRQAVSVRRHRHLLESKDPTRFHWQPLFLSNVQSYCLPSLLVLLLGVIVLACCGGQWWNTVVLADMPQNRRLSYFCFAMAFGISLGTLQFVGPVQNTVFMELVGPQQEPVANSMVFMILFPLVVCYGIAVTKLPSARVLVLAVCGFFMIPFFLVALILAVAEQQPPTWVAWLLYFTAESRNVILMPMIWSVVTDVSTSELSKKAYPFMFFVGQICGMAGSSAAISVQSLGGSAGLLFIQALALMAVAAFTWAGCSLVDERPEDAEEATSNSALFMPDAKSGAEHSVSLTKIVWRCMGEGLEGIWLLVSRPYVFMTFFVSNANLMTRTIMNYQLMIMVKQTYPNAEYQVSYFGAMTLVQNVAIALVTLLGTRRLVEFLTVGKVLLILPIASTMCMAVLCISPQLMMATIASIAASTVAYSLNSPCKEILFVYTSRSIKYKAKSWSDMYGNHLMKLVGAVVNILVNRETYACTPDCFLAGPTFVVAGIWFAIWVAIVFKIDRQVQELDSHGARID